MFFNGREVTRAAGARPANEIESFVRTATELSTTKTSTVNNG